MDISSAVLSVVCFCFPFRAFLFFYFFQLIFICIPKLMIYLKLHSDVEFIVRASEFFTFKIRCSSFHVYQAYTYILDFIPFC